jgi:hypothetical protein
MRHGCEAERRLASRLGTREARFATGQLSTDDPRDMHQKDTELACY